MIEDIVKTKTALEILGVERRINSIEQKQIWTVSGVRTVNSVKPDGMGNIDTDDMILDHTLLSNLNSANYTHLTAVNHTDLTDGGNTTLHIHSIYALTALSNLASVAINTTLVSDTNITDDLGTSSIYWRKLYIGGDSTTTAYGIAFGSDCQLYRSATTTLRMDNSLIVNAVSSSFGTSVQKTASIIYCSKTYTDTSGIFYGYWGQPFLAPSGALTSSLNAYGAIFNSYWNSDQDGSAGGTPARIYGVEAECQSIKTNTGGLNVAMSGHFYVRHFGGGVLTTATGVNADVRNDFTSGGSQNGNITTAYGLKTTFISGKTTGIIVTGYHLYVSDCIAGTATGGFTTQYGLYLENLDYATNNYGIYVTDAGTMSLTLASDDGDAASGIQLGTTNPVNIYKSAANVLTINDGLIVTLGFGCNGTTAQTSYASGGAVATSAGIFGFGADAERAALTTLVANIRTALINVGIMS